MGKSKFKLYYFGFKFRAEVIKLILEIADKPYEEICFEQSRCPEYKSVAPFGTAPFLAHKFKLAGKSDKEIELLNMYAGKITELINLKTKVIEENDYIAEIIYYTETVPSYLEEFDCGIKKSRSGYFAPSGITWVDLYLFCFLDILDPRINSILNKFENVRKMQEKVSLNPKIAVYLMKRSRK